MNSVQIEIVGLIAASFTTLAFVPQVFKIWKNRNISGVSISMYVFVLWSFRTTQLVRGSSQVSAKLAQKNVANKLGRSRAGDAFAARSFARAYASAYPHACMHARAYVREYVSIQVCQHPIM